MRLLLSAFTLIFISLLFSHCSNVSNIEGLDTESWKADRNGCSESRRDLEKSFLEGKDKLMGYSQREIDRILGKPDEVDLYKRNQKFFIYHIYPGKPCQGINTAGRPRSLYIRFSAMDVSNEVFVRDYWVNEVFSVTPHQHFLIFTAIGHAAKKEET